MSAPQTAITTTGALRDALAEELRVQIARQRVTGRELARRLGVSSQWISQRTRGVVPMDADDIEVIAECLGITISELVIEAIRRAESELDEAAPAAPPTRSRRPVTGTRTHRYLTPSGPVRREFRLITGGAEGYPAVPDCNGSSPGHDASPRGASSARAVNNAHSA